MKQTQSQLLVHGVSPSEYILTHRDECSEGKELRSLKHITKASDADKVREGGPGERMLGLRAVGE